MNLRLFLIGVIGVASSALADQRGYSVTSFTRVRIEGPVTVIIETGTSPGARAEGDRDAVDRIHVESTGDQLMIGIDRTNWTGDSSAPGNGRAVLHVTAPGIETLSVIGAGDVTVDRARGARFALTLTGAGRAAIDHIDVDQLTVLINGAGSAKLAGRARQVRMRSQGEGEIDAKLLLADDADASLIGAGEIDLRVNRAAHNILKGSGRIVVDGGPACTGTSEGSGEIICGAP